MSTLRVNTVQNAAGTGTPSAGQLGQGQTWQNLTASRAISTGYTNSTGRAIAVHIVGLGSGGSGGFITLTVDGVAIESQQAYTSNARVTVDAVVPAGGTYTLTASAASLSTWLELRT